MVSIVIPAYNEEAVIEENMLKLKAWSEKNLKDFEIVIVSDGSTDRTRSIVREKLVCENIIDVGYDKNFGKGGALKTGILACRGDIIVTTDCDLAYGLEVIKPAVEYLKSHADSDILIGSRSIHKEGFKGYPFIRKLASKIYFKMISFYAGLKLSDSQCGFKCYKQSCAKELFSSLETYGFAFDLEILLRAQRKKLSIFEMPIKIINHKESKISVLKDSLKMLSDIKKIKKICKKK